MLRNPRGGRFKGTETVPAFLLTETLRRSFAARMHPSRWGFFLSSITEQTSVQSNFIFPVAGSNLSARTIGHRLYFPKPER